MRQIILEIEDSAYEKFMGMVELCPQVKVVSTGEMVDVVNDRDYCMMCAINTLRENHVFRFNYDYTWIMMAINEGVMDDFEDFESPQTFIDYLYELGVDHLPDRSTISRACSKTFDSYPNWRFLDVKKPSETLRRKNVVKQFLSAFGEAKRARCNKNCTK